MYVLQLKRKVASKVSAIAQILTRLGREEATTLLD